MHLARNELCDLAALITNTLRDFAEGLVERFKTYINLNNFHRLPAGETAY